MHGGVPARLVEDVPTITCLLLRTCLYVAIYISHVHYAVGSLPLANNAMHSPSNGPSEKRTNSIQRTELMPPLDTVHLNLRERTPPNFRTTDTDRTPDWLQPIHICLRKRTLKPHPPIFSACDWMPDAAIL